MPERDEAAPEPDPDVPERDCDVPERGFGVPDRSCGTRIKAEGPAWSSSGPGRQSLAEAGQRLAEARRSLAEVGWVWLRRGGVERRHGGLALFPRSERNGATGFASESATRWEPDGSAGARLVVQVPILLTRLQASRQKLVHPKYPMSTTYSDETLKSAGRLKCAGVFYPQTGRLKCVADLSVWAVQKNFRLRRAFFLVLLAFHMISSEIFSFFWVADLSVFWIFSRPPTGRLKCAADLSV